MLLPDPLRRALGLLLLLPVLLLAGCTPSYWRGITQTSQVNSTVVTSGKVLWTGETAADDKGVFSTRWNISRTPPRLSLALLDRSVGVDLEFIVVEYLTPVGDSPVGTGIADLEPIIFPYIAHITPESPLVLTLPEILSIELVNASDPNNLNSELIDLDIDARLAFWGRNKLGQRIIWRTVVPISIEVVRL